MSIEDTIRSAVKEAVEGALSATPVGPRLLTAEQAAEYLSCSTRQVSNLVAAGKLKPVRWEKGGKPYYDRVDLDRAIEELKAA